MLYLKQGVSLDLATKDSYGFTIQVTDEGGASAPKPTPVTLTVITPPTAPTVSFTPGNGDLVGASVNVVVTFTKAVRNLNDSALTNSNAHLVVELKKDGTGSDLAVSGRVTINANKTAITIDPANNLAPGNYTLERDLPATRTLSAGATGTDVFEVETENGITTTVTIVVTGANDAPTATVIAWVPPATDGSIAEDTVTSSRVKIADLSTDDVDDGDSHSFALGGMDGASFEIDGGELYLRQDVMLDHDTKDRYRFTVTATDRIGASAITTFTLSVINVNEAPAFAQKSYVFELEENRSGPVTLGTLTAIDPNAGDTVAYGISAGGKGLFAIDPTSGVLSYIGPGEDYESETHVYALTVSATDGEGLSAEASVTVKVTDEEAGTARARLARVNEAILPELSRAIVSGVVKLVADRIQEARANTAGEGRLAIAGRSVRATAGVRWNGTARWWGRVSGWTRACARTSWPAWRCPGRRGGSTGPTAAKRYRRWRGRTRAG